MMMQALSGGYSRRQLGWRPGTIGRDSAHTARSPINHPLPITDDPVLGVMYSVQAGSRPEAAARSAKGRRSDVPGPRPLYPNMTGIGARMGLPISDPNARTNREHALGSARTHIGVDKCFRPARRRA